jgi:hypothetical protein
LIVEASSNSLTAKMIIYIEEFMIDAAYKVSGEVVNKNINNDKEIKAGVESIVNNYIKVRFNLGAIEKVNANSQQPLLNARHFMKKDFSKTSTSSSIFNISDSYLKQAESSSGGMIVEDDFDSTSRITNTRNLLLKADIAILSPELYIFDDDMDNIIRSKHSKINWTLLFVNTPTIKDKKPSEALIPSKSDLEYYKAGSDKSFSFFLTPSRLKLDLKQTSLTTEKFLEHKVKRQQTIPEMEKLPPNVRNLLQKYGDICANINNEIFEKYKFYKKFQEFSEKEQEKVDLK